MGATIIKAIVTKNIANCGVKEAIMINPKAQMQTVQIMIILYKTLISLIIAPIFLFNYNKI
ncbi:hypothetical protein [Campylobacter sp. RM16190]|uniref:hypothetical protein n=1 Tax=Campylobacter sp. RM16190 TaxID=1705727 RepID=UPI001474983B|nr:hypothetical protein [Campylobacter sp. RM16190]